jgi:hypothetical protein
MKGSLKYYNDDKLNYIFIYKGTYVDIKERYINRKLFGITIWKLLEK